jgi:hypothetical protein
MRQKTFLRVHVIPPLDGIYAQWDFNAGRVTKYYNRGARQPAVSAACARCCRSGFARPQSAATA